MQLEMLQLEGCIVRNSLAILVQKQEDMLVSGRGALGRARFLPECFRAVHEYLIQRFVPEYIGHSGDRKAQKALFDRGLEIGYDFVPALLGQFHCNIRLVLVNDIERIEHGDIPILLYYPMHKGQEVFMCMEFRLSLIHI